MLTTEEMAKTKAEIRQAHSSLRLAIEEARKSKSYMIFLDIVEAELLSSFCDLFLYE